MSQKEHDLKANILVLYNMLIHNESKYSSFSRTKFDELARAMLESPHDKVMDRKEEFEHYLKGCGSKKTVTLNALQGLRGDWSAMSSADFNRAITQANKMGDKRAEQIALSAANDDKLQALTIELLQVVKGKNLSPSDKKKLLSRLAGALDVKHQNEAPAPAASSGPSSKKKKVLENSAPKERSKEEKALMDRVSSALDAVRAESKKVDGGKLPPDHPLIKEKSEAEDALRSFRRSLSKKDESTKNIDASSNRVQRDEKPSAKASATYLEAASKANGANKTGEDDE